MKSHSFLDRRNFVAELSANKSVRLIFNGHVLRPETRTLRDCGLFSNCVVHCLVRAAPPPPSAADATGDPTQTAGAGDQQPTTRRAAAGGGASNINRATNTDHHHQQQQHNNDDPEDRVAAYLKYMSIITAAAGVTVSLAWYARYHYGHLFTVSSTVGLSLTTGMLGCIWMVLRRLHQRVDVVQAADQRLAAAAAVARRRRQDAEARREVASMIQRMVE